MTKLIIIVVIVFVLLAVAAIVVAKLKAGTPAQANVYYLRKALFTAAERSFLGVLEQNLPAGTRVFGKVRLEDIFGVKSGLERGERTAARNRINRKHVDFLIVRISDLVPIAGVELDDSSHEEEDRKERDQFVDAVFASGGIPLLHFPAQKAYQSAEIKAKLAGAFSTKQLS